MEILEIRDVSGDNRKWMLRLREKSSKFFGRFEDEIICRVWCAISVI